LPSRLLVNTNLFPSGDQSGSVSAWGEVGVTFTWPLPLAFMTKMSKSPSRSVVNAILLPSGDHAGSKSLPPSLVSCVVETTLTCARKGSNSFPLPGTMGSTTTLNSMTQMSVLTGPPVSTARVKAIRVPSGAQVGW
jgi:hypothetical protein